MKQQVKTREQISPEFKWDIKSMYSSDNDCLNDINDSLEMARTLREFRGQILNSSGNLLETLTRFAKVLRLSEKAFVYAHMKHDEDNANPVYIDLLGKANANSSQIGALASFIVPEILEGNADTIHQFIKKEPGLSLYEFMLDEILKDKAHTLSHKEEFLLANLGEVLGCPEEIFTALNDADFEFGLIKTSDGEIPLTHGTYSILMESDDQKVREDAYNALYSVYQKFNTTLATTYNYNTKTDTINARLRSYDSSLAAALEPNRIPLSVYHNLIDAVHHHLPSLHQYMEIRKSKLGLSEMHMSDIYAPLVKLEPKEYSFEDAVGICTKALSPLGEDYVAILENGLLNQGWADIYENKGKTSGAYSFGSYDSKPFILLNWTSSLRDVFTLIHESGHSMHSYYTRHTQDYIYGDHHIFTAEVASTVNETLLIKYLLDNTDDLAFREYLISFYLDEFRATLFRQTQFAEFELFAHSASQNGDTLTAELLNNKYDEINKRYYGEALSYDDMIQYEWSRIPHFYRSFYVYQYATGYSAANAISNKILKEGPKAAADYKEFLSLGSSKPPIDLLKVAGVDMSSVEPIEDALSTFDALVIELAKF